MWSCVFKVFINIQDFVKIAQACSQTSSSVWGEFTSEDKWLVLYMTYKHVKTHNHVVTVVKINSLLSVTSFSFTWTCQWIPLYRTSWSNNFSKVMTSTSEILQGKQFCISNFLGLESFMKNVLLQFTEHPLIIRTPGF